MTEIKLITSDFHEQVKMIDREMKAAEEWRKTHPRIKIIDYIGLLRPN